MFEDTLGREADSMGEPWRSRLDLPVYSAREAARLVGVAPQTIAGWFYGYPSSAGARAMPVFAEGKRRRAKLSYLQLVELAFVASCRRNGLSLVRVRAARNYLAETLGTDHPFATNALVLDGPHILTEFEDADAFIYADRGGQLAWRDFIAERLSQFEYHAGLALRWHPLTTSNPIVVDPRFNFGQPFLRSSGVATKVVAGAAGAGESALAIAADLGVSPDEVEAAIRFESQLRAA
jgi:uncharacterized protein (DUF433 family)